MLSVGAAACDAQGESSDAPTQTEAKGEAEGMEGMSDEEHKEMEHKEMDHGSAGHGEDGSHGSGGHASGDHGSQHNNAAALTPALLTSSDLPAYYAKGAGHHQVDTDAAAPKVGQACAPIAELIGTHPSVRQTEHPQASVTFTNGHFGQQVSETIIDYGNTAAARQARERLERATRDCDRYVQSTSPIGANDYTVQPAIPGWKGPEGTSLRLKAVGSDFDMGLTWDVWVTRSGSQLAAVALRSALGGDNADLPPAVDAAMAALDQT